MWLWLQKLMSYFQGEAEQRVEEEIRTPVNPAPRQLKAKTKNIYPKERANNRDTDDFRLSKERQFRFPVVPDEYQLPKRKNKEMQKGYMAGTREQASYEQERTVQTRETPRGNREAREKRETPVVPKTEPKVEKQPPARFEPNREQTRQKSEKPERLERSSEKMTRPTLSAEEKRSYTPSDIISPVYGKITPSTREIEHRIHTTSGIVYPRLEQEEQLNQIKQWEKEISERYFPEDHEENDSKPDQDRLLHDLGEEARKEALQAVDVVAPASAAAVELTVAVAATEAVGETLEVSAQLHDAPLSALGQVSDEIREREADEPPVEVEFVEVTVQQTGDMGVNEAEPVAPLESVEEVEPVAHMELTEEIEEVEPVAHMESTEEIEEVEPVAHMESTEEIEEVEPVAHMEPTEEIEEVEPVAHMESTEEIEEVELVAHNEPTEEIEETELAVHLESAVDTEEIEPAVTTVMPFSEQPEPIARKSDTLAADVNTAAPYAADVNRLLERAGLDQQKVVQESHRPLESVSEPTRVAEPEQEQQQPVLDPEPEKIVQPPYVIPQLELLNPSPPPSDDDDEHTQLQKLLLEETLSNFNVSAHVVGIVKGPSVTRFELQPAPGVKVNKITSLVDDIKLNLAAKDIRIEAPIPGRNAIGIEVPNLASQPVLIEKMIGSEKFQQHPSPLAVALGMDIGGEPIIADIKKMPHGLIAGSTGSGKSVCINSIIVSLLYKATPEQVRLLLIDPKMVELAPYNHLPHLVTPVVTEAKQATAALKWCVEEMEKRYALFVDAGVRDIDRYNQTTDDTLPFIVIVIDELADLMMVSPQDVEDCIIRIAQKARACGIHLLLATQRPSVDVITGNIKANVPTRLAFAVFSQVDSRTILDQSGAERLLGRGDMLFLESGTTPVRLQGNFVSDDEIERITHMIKKQRKPEYLFSKEDLEQQVQSFDAGDDPLYFEALIFVAEQGQASASGLQRRFRVGYNRAARLIEMMETDGYVAGQSGGKARAVLISLEDARAVVEGSTLV
ncbi:DNA translocase SftA [Brevibacillus reuszeri]|uniref:DNA translocase FtsK n=1 Tax=Brevibacillus reuszeri TaxID=54915 RepID=UPI001B26EF9F|nr:DNA translocase FtsK [Brevibacillus reuszeri]GIO09085.1 DNA translocase SftA [Brevibacillus reuszeri]